MSGELDFIHRFIPSDNSNNKKTLLLFHGTGGNENSMLQIAHIVLPGSNVLSPRGKVLENGMPRFFRRLSEGVFDMEDLKTRTNEIAGFIRDSVNKYNLDPNNVIAIGYSNGANIASSLIFTYPELISKAALFHPMIPFIPDRQPDLSSLNVLITAGTNDPIVSREETVNLQNLYLDFAAEVELFWHDMGHSLTREELERTRVFFSES